MASSSTPFHSDYDSKNFGASHSGGALVFGVYPLNIFWYHNSAKNIIEKMEAKEAGLKLKIDDEDELERRVANGDGYEVSCLYEGLMGRLRTVGKHEEAERAGTRGCKALAVAGQAAMATPIALLVVESMEKRSAIVNDALVVQLLALLAAFSSNTSATSQDEVAVGQANKASAQKLTVGAAACKLVGYDPAAAPLNQAHAADLASVGRLGDAAKYLAVSRAPLEYASLLQQWSQKGYDGERDLFAARALLHVLCLGKSSAVEVSQLHAALQPRLLVASPLAPVSKASHLERFLALLIELLGLVQSHTVGARQAGQAFQQLLQAYAPSLQGRDPRVGALAARVGVVHFGLKPPPSPLQGIMDMFGMAGK